MSRGPIVTSCTNDGRSVWEMDIFPADNKIVFTHKEDGSLLVEVDEEKAVDSYNQTFTCSITIPPEIAEAF